MSKEEIIKTEWRVNKCKCGNVVTLKMYLEIVEGESYEESKKRLKDIYKNSVRIGFCKCGNIFIKERRTKK